MPAIRQHGGPRSNDRNGRSGELSRPAVHRVCMQSERNDWTLDHVRGQGYWAGRLRARQSRPARHLGFSERQEFEDSAVLAGVVPQRCGDLDGDVDSEQADRCVTCLLNCGCCFCWSVTCRLVFRWSEHGRSTCAGTGRRVSRPGISAAGCRSRAGRCDRIGVTRMNRWPPRVADRAVPVGHMLRRYERTAKTVLRCFYDFHLDAGTGPILWPPSRLRTACRRTAPSRPRRCRTEPLPR
jgi:hypothetical protein